MNSENHRRAPAAVLCAALSLCTLAWSGSAVGAETVPPSTSAQDIQQALSAAKARKESGKAWTTLGGVIMSVGLLVTVAQSTEDHEGKSSDEEMVINWTGFGVAAAIGGPMLAVGITRMAKSSREIRRLEREKLRVSVAPQSDGAQIGIAWAF